MGEILMSLMNRTGGGFSKFGAGTKMLKTPLLPFPTSLVPYLQTPGNPVNFTEGNGVLCPAIGVDYIFNYRGGVWELNASEQTITNAIASATWYGFGIPCLNLKKEKTYQFSMTVDEISGGPFLRIGVNYYEKATNGYNFRSGNYIVNQPSIQFTTPSYDEFCALICIVPHNIGEYKFSNLTLVEV